MSKPGLGVGCAILQGGGGGFRFLQSAVEGGELYRLVPCLSWIMSTTQDSWYYLVQGVLAIADLFVSSILECRVCEYVLRVHVVMHFGDGAVAAKDAQRGVRRPGAIDLSELHASLRAVDTDESELPLPGQRGVVGAVDGTVRPVAEADDPQSRVRPEQLANAVPVLAVEAIEVGLNLSALARRQVFDRSGLCRPLELAASAVQHRLHAAHRRADDLGGLLQRVLEHILQNQAGTLLRR